MSPNTRYSLSHLSPAKKAERRVMNNRSHDNRRSFDSTATASTLGEMPVVDASHHLPVPSRSHSTANR
ncbi:hypothetical protein GGTG_03344 [Gaeumannomyces tritici R3-111a-1]|uniref:Uncharacterized protein n=1 Tax=Gaeumannomyces tritici (strain R3-111a-1) TaxID=644352 RepID=J3NPY6_GAET3|nr:hypothetical protein GGTG_03344 [Gaeumannomyces tritici R3-111a-1]EJT78242.1 hypothetical protein GGTG_03344 [Gaeumannomyces tritici R3-111a-1]